MNIRPHAVKVVTSPSHVACTVDVFLSFSLWATDCSVFHLGRLGLSYLDWLLHSSCLLNSSYFRCAYLTSHHTHMQLSLLI